MKKIFFLSLFFTISHFINAQTLERVNQFYHNIALSDSAYKNKDYNKAIALAKPEYDWLKSIHQLDRTPEFAEVPYNLLCEYSLANKLDDAFKLLNNLLLQAGFHSYLEAIYSDSDLINMRNDKRWKKEDEKIKNIQKSINEKLDTALIATLDTLRKKDQQPRFEYLDTLKKYGSKSPIVRAQGLKLLEQDSVNLASLLSLLDQYGFPSIDKVGENGELTVYLIIQHAPPAIQKKYLPEMEAAAKRGDMRLSHLAYLKDRILMRDGKLQIYGSQQVADDHGKVLNPYPLEDPENVNVRRFNVGLYSMEKYYAAAGVAWNVEEYNKALPMLMEKLEKIRAAYSKK